MQAEIDSRRGQNVDRFLFGVAAVVAREAPHLEKCLDQIFFEESHSEDFKAWVERIKNQAGNVLEIFTYPPLLKILRQPSAGAIPAEYHDGGEEMDATREAWEVGYVGQTASLLRAAINQMNADRGNKEYANFVPIVQSSGTGKSRTVDELARYVFTLPFNLRPLQDTSGYPEADHGLLRCLCPATDLSSGKPPTAVELHLRYRIFFKCLFEAVEKQVSNMEPQESSEMLALMFYSWLTRNRSEIYASVIEETNTGCSIIDKQVGSIKSSGSSIQQVWKSLKTLMSQTAGVALEVGERLVELIKEKSSGRSSSTVGNAPVWLVLYFDESHPLTAMQPTPDDGKNFTAYQILCSTLDKFRHLDLFGIFISTNPSISKISSYSPPQPIYPSSRVRVSYTPGVQVPFTELSFDKYNGECLLEEDLHTLEDVCDPKHMVRFGRPLFWTRYLCGDDDVRSNIIEFACKKLVPKDAMPGTYPPQVSYASIAILSVRLGLTFDRSRQFSLEVVSRLVERHMHLAFAATQHREWMRIGPSCEPVLAEAAAQLMHRENMHMHAAALLSGWSKHGLLAEGNYRGLILRLLLTLAHDRAIQLQSSPCPSSKWMSLWPKSPIPSIASFSKPVSVPEFLTALLGHTRAKIILDSKPDNITGGVTLAESDLGQAQLNFTHWGKAEDDSIITDEAAWIALGRCMAWQCSDHQQDVDHITPLLLRDEKLGRYTVSAIFWQTNHPLKPHQTDIDIEKTGFFSLHPDPGNRANSRPYLVITVDLSAEAANLQDLQEATGTQSGITTLQDKQVSPGNSAKSPGHPRYTATIFGCSEMTYSGVIGSRDVYAYDILLASGECFAEHPRRDPEFLQAIADMKPSWGKRGGSVGSFSGVYYADKSRLTRSGDSREPTGSEPVEGSECVGVQDNIKVGFYCGVDANEADGTEDEDCE